MKIKNQAMVVGIVSVALISITTIVSVVNMSMIAVKFNNDKFNF